MNNILFYQDVPDEDSGYACISILSKFYGKPQSIVNLKKKSINFTPELSFGPLIHLAEKVGFRVTKVKLSSILSETREAYPMVARFEGNRFVVFYQNSDGKLYISDPATGDTTHDIEEALRRCSKNGEPPEVLSIRPGRNFNPRMGETEKKGSDFRFLTNYLRPYKKFIIQLFLGMFAGTLINLAFPFITQSIIDKGIENTDMNFIYLALIGQLVLQFSSISLGFVRRWITLYMSAKIDIEMISDFLIKLMKLPLDFFENRSPGDILQRIDDQKRIESFVTNSAINFTFSIFNFVFFSLVLAYYNYKILAVFMAGTVLYVLWITIFIDKRRRLDNQRFAVMSKNQSILIELINSVQEIKLYNCESEKRWNWGRVQANIVKVGISTLRLEQSQQAGSSFIVQLTNVFIMLFAAKAVIDGDITLGMMIAILFITGQLASPVNEFIGFIHAYQDSRLSIQRVEAVHNEEEEGNLNLSKVSVIPPSSNIRLRNVHFRYNENQPEDTLKSIDVTIPHGKVTAIVGESGSGKTTLIKLLLNFYEPTHGDIEIGDINLDYFDNHFWRSNCAAVLQDGYIFSDTIAANVALGAEVMDMQKLVKACRLANIEEFIKSLSLGYETLIGNEGISLSQGQRQRILIARAIYKEPEFLFFDEATNALDSINEKVINTNLEKVFLEKTVVVIAHRLSTVKNAHQILVMDKGEIIEKGSHNDLINRGGAYFNLFKNQMETAV